MEVIDGDLWVWKEPCKTTRCRLWALGVGPARTQRSKQRVERVRVEPFEVRADVVVEVITLTLTSYFSRALLTPLKLTLNTR